MRLTGEVDFHSHLEGARQLVEDGHYERARQLLETLIEQGPASASVRELLLDVERKIESLLFASGVKLLANDSFSVARDRLSRVCEMHGAHAQEAHALLSKIRTREIPSFAAPIADSARPQSGATEVRRIPHMDAPSSVAPGETFSVWVYADTSPVKDDEDSEPIVLPVESVESPVEVELIASEHFTIEGAARCTLVIKASEEKSNIVEFHLGTTPGQTSPKAGITALFTYGGRPSGKVSRRIGVGIMPESLVGVKPTRNSLCVENAATPADLTIVISADPANDGRQYWCKVQTNLLRKYTKGVTERWNLTDDAFDIVNGYMADFTARSATPLQRIAALLGAGRRLFEAAPKIFCAAFWELVDAGKLPSSISIVSEEPYFPWELMIPSRKFEGVSEVRLNPLGVDFVVGRWTEEGLVSARQRLSFRSSYVLAPKYDGSKALPFAQTEADHVTANFNGHRIHPATFDNLLTAFEAGGGRPLVHIACHGGDCEGTRQRIQLEGNQQLSSDQLLMPELEAAFRHSRPLVFLNACEVGRTTAALTGVGGFAKSFIDIGASAVIAPLWSVKDTIAHEIAMDFYRMVKEQPQTPFAEILRVKRAKAYARTIGEDTYAAYCFYGDPNACAVID